MSTLTSLNRFAVNCPQVIPTTLTKSRPFAWQLCLQFSRHSGYSSLSVRVTCAPHREATNPGSAVPAPIYETKFFNCHCEPKSGRWLIFHDVATSQPQKLANQRQLQYPVSSWFPLCWTRVVSLSFGVGETTACRVQLQQISVIH